MRLPVQLQRAMAAEAEAAREARAKVTSRHGHRNHHGHHEGLRKTHKTKFKVIAAEGEHKASRALRHAAEVIAESPSALQVTIFVLYF